MDERLSDGRKYLLGNELRYVDIAWASLGAPLIVSDDLYCNGKFKGNSVCEDDYDILDPTGQLKKDIQKIRSYKSAQFIKDLYAKFRNASIE